MCPPNPPLRVGRWINISQRRHDPMKVACAVVCIALAGWVDAQAAVCVTKSKKGVIKKVTIRETCAKKETAMPASGLLQRGPHVLDSGGKEVGALVDRGSVSRQIGTQLVTFRVNSK